MALLKPVDPYVQGLPWGPSPLKTAEPAGYGYLGRFWYSNPGYPFKFYKHYHPALDMGQTLGTPIKASETGIVTAIGTNPYSSSSGIRYNVRIRTSPTVKYGGGHMNSVGKNPRTGKAWAVGDKIKRGEIIGTVGKTGYATGPHVHFFVQIGSMLYDPKLFFDGGYNANDWRIKPVY
jgi:murein DD-endopeptidase MepM/ murein hydrolase activator NlpD